MRKIQLFLASFLVIIMVAMLFIQCSKINDEVILEQNYELSKMLGVSDSGLDAKLAEMGFKPYEGQIQYRSLNCFTSGTGCWVRTGELGYMIYDEHCTNPFQVNVHFSVAICLDGTINFYDFSLESWNPCPELLQYLDGLSDHDLSVYLDKIYYKASQGLEQVWMYEYATRIATINSYFYTNQCYQWCLPIGDRNNSLKVRSDMPAFGTKVNCGEKCCVRNTLYYWDNGKLKSNAPIFTNIQGECETWPISECENGRFIGNCEHGCGQL